MTDKSEAHLYVEHARELFDEADMIHLPEPAQAQHLALTGIGRAVLAVAVELRRLNEGRDQFNATMLDFFERLTADPFEGPSGAGATAQVAEKEGP